MKTRVALVSLTAVLALAACGNTTPSCDAATGTLIGTNCVPYGTINLANTQGGTVVVKNSGGTEVAYNKLVPGAYTATLSKSGYQSQVLNFSVDSAGKVTPTTVTFATLVEVAPVVTNGSVGFVLPTGATVVVKNSAGVVQSDLNNLVPGTYTVVVSRDGFVARSLTFTVRSGQTTAIDLSSGWEVLKQTAYYLKNGVKTTIPTNAVASSFRFNAWLENRDASAARARAAGLVPGNLGKSGTAEATSAQELTERAPYGRQNLVGAYMQYNDGGTWYPVIGAEVRWDLLPSALPTDITAGLTTDATPRTNITDPNFTPNRLTNNYQGYLSQAVINEIARRGTLIRFTAADDGSQPSGANVVRPLDINDNGLSAYTWTNSAAGNNIPFPNTTTSIFRAYNQLGVANPNIDGFTWTAVQDQRADTFRPNTAATRTLDNGTVPELEGRVSQTRIRAIGYVNGMEINKVFLEKNFVPAAELEIRKDVIGGELGKINGSKSFRITIINRTPVAANDVRMTDILTSGPAANYAIRGIRGFLYQGTATSYNDANGDDLPDGAGVQLPNSLFTLTAVPGATGLPDDGFDVGNDASQLNIPAFSAVTFEFDAQGTAAAKYCDTATINTYLDTNLGDVFSTEDFSRNRVVTSGLSDDACMDLKSEPDLSIQKDAGLVINGEFVTFEDPRLQPGGSLYTFRRVNPNDPVTLRVIVRNTGTEGLNNVVVTDNLTTANAAAHQIVTLPAGATVANGNDGFTLNVGTLAAGASREFRFTASGSERGQYCDTVKVTGVGAINTTTTKTAQDDACFNVDIIRFTKVNQVIRDGKLVDATTVTDIARNEIVLTTVTLVNDGSTTLPNVRLYDTLARGTRQTVTTADPAGTVYQAIYEDRNSVIDPITVNLVDSSGRRIVFERVDAYDAKTAALGTLTSGKFAIPNATLGAWNFITNGVPYLPTTGDTNADNGRREQVMASDALRSSVTVIRTDDTVVNIGTPASNVDGYNPGGSANFDYSNSATALSEAAAAAMPGYSLAPGQQISLRFFSQLPIEALLADTYCNEAWWNYGDITNTTTGEPNRFDLTQQCVKVAPVVAIQPQLNDTVDPITVTGAGTRFTATLYNEVRSTEALKNNVAKINLGSTGTQFATAPEGTFNYGAVTVEYDPTPTVDVATGTVTPSAPLTTLVEGVDYTLAGDGTGSFTVTFINREILPGDAIFISTQATATTTGNFNSFLSWDSVGTVSNAAKNGLSSEDTTVSR